MVGLVDAGVLLGTALRRTASFEAVRDRINAKIGKEKENKFTWFRKCDVGGLVVLRLFLGSTRRLLGGFVRLHGRLSSCYAIN